METSKAQITLRSIKEQYTIRDSGGTYTVRIIAGAGRQTGLEGARGSLDDNLTNPLV